MMCVQYIIDAMDWKEDIIGLDRVETPEILVEAIREAVINSYGHSLLISHQKELTMSHKNLVAVNSFL